MADDSDSSSDEEPLPARHKNRESLTVPSHDYVAPLRDRAGPSISKPGRPKLFDASKANQWSKKSIAFEFQSMFEALRDQKEDWDAGGGSPSDIEFMSDSADANDEQKINKNFEHFESIMTELHTNQSYAEPKHETSKQMQTKLHALHDKIDVFIKKIGHEMVRTRNQKLVNTYQNAYDFLDEVQQELDAFEEDIADNDNKLIGMERNKQHAEKKYNSLMMKFKNAKSSEKELKAEAIDLRKQVYELSVKQSELMLQEANSMSPDDDDDDEEEEDLSDAEQEYVKPKPYEEAKEKTFESVKGQSYGYNLNTFNQGQQKYNNRNNYNNKATSKPKIIKPPPKPPKIKLREKKKIPSKPRMKYKQKSNIDVKKNPYLYDEYRFDNKNACVSEFFTIFGRETGFLFGNKQG